MNDHSLVRARTHEVRSPHNRLVALALCFFLGVFGVHRFYVGKWVTGVLLFLTGGGFGVWWIIDFIVLLLGRFRDDEGRVLGPPQVVYQLPAPAVDVPQRQRQKPTFEPELEPVREPDFAVDDELMRDPLEDKFAELERELNPK